MSNVLNIIKRSSQRTLFSLGLFGVLFCSVQGSVFSKSLPLHYESTKADQDFLRFLRERIASQKKILEADKTLEEVFSKTSFPKNNHGVGLIFYEPGHSRIVIVRRQKKALESLRKAMNRAMVHPRISELALDDPEKSRIQIDYFLEAPYEIPLKEILSPTKSSDRFELGVDGIRMSTSQKTAYFFPGDAFVRSVLGSGQLNRYLKKLIPETDLKNVTFKRFRTESYVSFKDQWIRLYRGIPVIEKIGKKEIEKVANRSVDYLMRTQAMDGRFMYYYDAASDSFKNHEHPKRDLEKNPYYNILRHSGGAVSYLFHYEVYGDKKYLEPTKRAIEYLVKQMKTYEGEDGRKAGYIFYNTKAKLGGTGLALYLITEYQRLSGDKQFETVADLLKNHTLNEIRPDGEFYYYHIYPGREKDDVRSFSFYYPGEALIGLATYLKHNQPAAEERERIIQKMKKALHFLLVDRKVKYARHYTSLPSDSWLMMAIFEAWEIPEMRDDLYKDFVFEDADKMVNLTYTKDNALYPDYVGSFYYHYGNHPYPDGARAEGLTGAYELAVLTGDEERAKKYKEALMAIAWATMHLVNTEESAYAVPNPDMTVDGIRFKLTRQWFRVDTIQHVVGFYLKFLPYLNNDDVFNPK